MYDIIPEEEDEEDAESLADTVLTLGAAILLRWSSSRDCCDFKMRLKKSSLGMVLPNWPTNLVFA